jgi:hypothetical protein
MRDETLRRLDEIIATAASVIAGADCGRQAIEDDWPVLRAELVAERCENCEYWDVDSLAEYGAPCLSTEFDKDVLISDEGLPHTRANFCCSHFTKREPTP